MPSDYDTGSLTNLSIYGWGTSTASEQVTVTLYTDTSATPCGATANAVSTNATWVNSTNASPLGACSIAAGDTVTFRVRLQAAQDNIARAGEISFSYKKKF